MKITTLILLALAATANANPLDDLAAAQKADANVAAIRSTPAPVAIISAKDSRVVERDARLNNPKDRAWETPSERERRLAHAVELARAAAPKIYVPACTSVRP